MEERCLDVTTLDNFNDAMLILQHEDGSQGDIFTAIGKLTFVLANLNYCNFRTPVVDLIAFCASPDQESLDTINKMSTAKLLAEVWHPKLLASKAEKAPDQDEGVDKTDLSIEKCSWKAVGLGLGKNVFLIIGKIGSIVAQIINFSALSPDKLHNECLEFGEDLGVFIRVALNFQPVK